MAAGSASLKEDILGTVNEKLQVSYEELSDAAFNRGVEESELKGCLADLEKNKLIASRSSGGILTYYPLQSDNELRKVLIVEDDKNINRLMSLSIGKGFETLQIYDGGEALKVVRDKRPDLLILDLMLPNKDGLDICQEIKSDPQLSSTIVILVSAMDPTNARFKGIKYGADYYIKKPFDPNELRSLVTLFLKKKGKRFDPLIDLPDEERISNQLEHSIKQGEKYVIGTLKVDHLASYAEKLGEGAAFVILRLISQLLQDSVRSKGESTFVGFLNSDEFVVAGMKDGVSSIVAEVTQEFVAVMPFILQDAGYRQIDLNMEALFESKEVPKLSLVFTEYEKEDLRTRRNEVLKNKGALADTPGAYSYEELQKIFGRDDLDITIKRDNRGVRLQVGKTRKGED
jgi:DNA-binding response OmpR family regulator